MVGNKESAASASFSRRCMHGPVYAKNIEDQVCPAMVPDDMITPLSEKYCAPNAHSGEGSHHKWEWDGEIGFYTFHVNEGSSESVLKQKTFFHPVEDLDLPELP